MLTRRLESKLPSTHRIVVIDANEFGVRRSRPFFPLSLPRRRSDPFFLSSSYPSLQSWPLSAHRAAVVPGQFPLPCRHLDSFPSIVSRRVQLLLTLFLSFAQVGRTRLTGLLRTSSPKIQGTSCSRKPRLSSLEKGSSRSMLLVLDLDSRTRSPSTSVHPLP